MAQEDKRESMYPFGDEEVTEVNAIKRQPTAETINSEGHQRLIHDILAGTVKTGYRLKPDQIAKYDLGGVVHAAVSKKKRAQQLHEALHDLTRSNRKLETDFWTTDLMAQLTDTLKEEYDDVVREELKETTLNPHLEPA